jgi:copper chaperone CopZ
MKIKRVVPPVLASAIALAAAAGLIAAGMAFAGDDPEANLPEGQARVEVLVKGMTCAGCASAIKTAVKKLDGVVGIDVDHEGGKATVVYEKEKVTVKKIVETINKTGFKATEPGESKQG